MIERDIARDSESLCANIKMCLTISKVCFCFNLKPATKVISVLYLLWSVFIVAMYSGAAFTLPSASQSKESFYLLAVSAGICQIICCCFLIYGTFWRRPGYLWPWLSMSWLTCIVLVLLSIAGVVLLTLQYADTVEESADISTMSSLYFVYAAILYYFIAIVNSRREEMLQEDQMESARLMRQRHFPKSLLV